MQCASYVCACACVCVWRELKSWSALDVYSVLSAKLCSIWKSVTGSYCVCFVTVTADTDKAQRGSLFLLTLVSQ